MNAIYPDAVIGIIGGGQLARMIAIEARRMGYRVAVLDPDPHGPAAQVADLHVQGQIDDLDAARKLAELSDVVTIDSEHIPADLLRELESQTAVRPGGHVLHQVQERLRQRRFLEAHGVPQPKHAGIESLDELTKAATEVGFPAVLKTRRDGYDGKGQWRVESLDELKQAWDGSGCSPCVLEEFVPFEREISAVLARGVDGKVAFYPVAENLHRNHILHTSHVPAAMTPEMRSEAEALGARIATALDHVGMIAIELFVTRDQRLLVNEIAPRTHNSGHFSLGACSTSQFEQHVRAICGLPLADPALLRPAVMMNLLGDLWHDGAPPWGPLLASPDARLHIYGKAEARIGRKMGHLLVLGDTVQEAMDTARQIEREIQPGRGANDS